MHVMDMMTDETHTAPQFSALFALTMALTTRAWLGVFFGRVEGLAGRSWVRGF